MGHLSEKQKLTDLRNKGVGVRNKGKEVKGNFDKRNASMNRIKEVRSRSQSEKTLMHEI